MVLEGEGRRINSKELRDGELFAYKIIVEIVYNKIKISGNNIIIV